MKAYVIEGKVQVGDDGVTGAGGHPVPAGAPKDKIRVALLRLLCEAKLGDILVTRAEAKRLFPVAARDNAVDEAISDIRKFLSRLTGAKRPVTTAVSRGWRLSCDVTPVTTAPQSYPIVDVEKELAGYGLTALTVVDDSVDLAPLRLEGDDELEVEYSAAQWGSIDLRSSRPTTEELIASLVGFIPQVAAFLDERLRVPDGMDAQWKLGTELVQPPIAALDSASRLAVRPLSYRVTEMFNRACVRRLIAKLHSGEASPHDVALDELLPVCLRTLLSSGGSFKFPFPSQLFVEVAVVTRDEQCLLMRKRNDPGVVAGIGRSWTCGPEFGLLASHLEEGSEPGQRRIAVRRVIERALEKEMGVAPTALTEWRIAGIALQRVHLNTALYGYCRLSLTGAELMAAFVQCGRRLLEKGAKDPFHRGLQPNEPKPELVSASALPDIVSRPRRYDGELWHPTGLIRLRSLLAAR